ncbi:response regulator transcription factor [Streptococcus uberis]
MNIYILEDNLSQLFYLEKLIKQILLQKNRQNCKVKTFEQPKDLINNVKERGNHQLFFLDIELGQNDKLGLLTAKKIKELDPLAIIVFISSHSEFLPLTFRYQTEAFDFIDKNLCTKEKIERITRAINFVINNSHSMKTSFFFENQNNILQIPFEKIFFIETSSESHRLILHGKNEIIEFYGSISEVLKQEPRLLKSHRSYIINPNNVVKIDKKERTIYFERGIKCYTSRSKLKFITNSISNIRKEK